jgi:diazepam-binding inhibitor (GABA receptor modulator, acyl-CoA-binding protein)
LDCLLFNLLWLQEDFDVAAEEAKALPESTTNDDRLALYGLFKQATVGDNTTSKPGIFDPKGRAKWDAWENQKGKGSEDAMRAYIELVKELQVKYAS